MKTDRELLELAARSAGNVVAQYGIAENAPFWDVTDESNHKPWNPLTDDGDALRLAVKLGIEIHPDREVEEVVTAFCVRNPALIGLNTMEEFNGDEMAATRRAITRAAAQMQLNKEQQEWITLLEG